MNDILIDLSQQYQKDLLEVERDYQQCRIDIEQDYCQSIERAFQATAISVDNLIPEYVEMIKASPFWRPL